MQGNGYAMGIAYMCGCWLLSGCFIIGVYSVIDYLFIPDEKPIPLGPSFLKTYAKDVMAALKDHKEEVHVHQVHHKEELGEFKGSKYLFSVDSSETISADFDASVSLKGKNGIVSGSFGIARDGVSRAVRMIQGAGGAGGGVADEIHTA